MRKLISNEETTDILISHGPIIGNIPGNTYLRGYETSQNMLTTWHRLDSPDFYIEYDIKEDERSGRVMGEEFLIIGAHNLAAFLVDAYSDEFGNWRDRFDSSKRILATRDKDNDWTEESLELADYVVTVAKTGMKLLPLVRQMTFKL